MRLCDTGISIKSIYFKRRFIAFENIIAVKRYRRVTFNWGIILVGCVGVEYVNKNGDKEFIHICLLDNYKFLEMMSNRNIPILLEEKPSNDEFAPYYLRKDLKGKD